MFTWFKKRTTAFWLFVLYALNFIWDNFGKPVLGLNVENWAVSRGIDNELVDGGKETLPMIDQFLYAVLKLLNTLSDYFASDWFFGFVCGALIFSFWDPVAKGISKFIDRAPPHPSLAPINGLHPAILAIEYDGDGGFRMVENYGVERWVYTQHRNDRIMLVVFFERQTGIERIEVLDLSGSPLKFKKPLADNRVLVLEFSKRIIRNGVRISAYNVADTRTIAKGGFVSPRLPQGTATEKQQ